MKKSDYNKEMETENLPMYGDIFPASVIDSIVEKLGCEENDVKLLKNKQVIKNGKFKMNNKKYILNNKETDIQSFFNIFGDEEIELFISFKHV